MIEIVPTTTIAQLTACACGCGKLANVGKTFIHGHGSRVRIVPRRPLADRFWEKVEKTPTCWLWKANKNKNGYGLFRVDESWKQKVMGAHRLAYTLLRGPVPSNLVLDHLCRNRACVNPEHMEVVTQAENNARMVTHNELKQYCKNGHPFDESNTRIRRDGSRRDCKMCGLASSRRSYARQKGKAQ